MSSFSALKTAIQAAIKQNGNNEITGDILQEILLSIVSTLGDSAINTLESDLSTETTNRQNADGDLQEAISDEATARTNADTTLNNLITGIKNNVDNGYVYAGISTPSTTPVSGKVFYIATQAGTYTNIGNTAVTQGITILKYNGSSWVKEQVIYTDGGVFDVSAFNGGATFASLEALLSDANLSTIIPSAVRKGGMSIKFVCTSDNNYVQYRLMAQSFSTTVSDWQGIDDRLIAGSKNLAESGNIEAETKGYHIDFSEKEVIATHYILSNGNWTTTTEYDYGCYIIATNSRLASFKNNTTNNLSVSFLKSYPTQFSGHADFCLGISSPTVISPGVASEVQLPSDVVCIVIFERNCTNKNKHLDTTLYGGISEYSILPGSFDYAPTDNSVKILTSGSVKHMQDSVLGSGFLGHFSLYKSTINQSRKGGFDVIETNKRRISSLFTYYRDYSISVSENFEIAICKYDLDWNYIERGTSWAGSLNVSISDFSGYLMQLIVRRSNDESFEDNDFTIVSDVPFINDRTKYIPVKPTANDIQDESLILSQANINKVAFNSIDLSLGGRNAKNYSVGDYIDISSLITNRKVFLINGNWQNNDDRYVCAFIPIMNIRSFSITSSSEYQSSFALLKIPYRGIAEAASFATGYSDRVQMSLGETLNVNVPGDALCLYITIEAVVGNIAPSNIIVTRICEDVYLPTLMSKNKQEETEYMFGCNYAKDYVEDESIFLDDYDVIAGRIYNDWYDYKPNSKAYIIPVTNIKQISITANSSNQCNYSLLMSKDFVNGEKVKFAGSADKRGVIPAGETIVIDVPYNCTYIYVDKLSAAQLDLKPSSVVVTEIYKDNSLSKKINIIQNGAKKEGSNGDMNLCIVSWDKEDSAQSYWYYPSVISTNYIHRNVYTTFTDHEGYTGVIQENLFDHSIIKTKLKRMLGSSSVSDTHNSAFVSLLPDRRVICGYPGGHNQDNKLYIRISKKPECIEDFEDVVEVEFEGGTCYGQYFYIGSKHYVFLRVALKYWAYAVSEDLVEWSTHTLIEAPEQYYLMLKPVKDNPNVLRMAMYANASLEDTNVRVGYIDFSTGNVLNSDFETVLGNISGNTVLSTAFNIIIARTPIADNELQRLYDVAVTNISDLKILYARKSSDDRYSGKYYIYENGTSSYLCDSGNPFITGSAVLGGVAFISDNKIVVGRSVNNTYGNNIIEIWSKSSNSWSFTKKIYEEKALQPDDINHIRNGYPIVDVNGKILVWQRGNYPNIYTDATMDSIFYDIDKDCVI